MSITVDEIKKHVSGDKLHLINKKLTDKDALVICEFLKENTFITHLDLSHNDIGPEGAQALKDFQGTTLNVSGNAIGNEGAKALTEFKGKRLIMRCNNISDQGAEEFTKKSAHKHFLEIDLTKNEISQEIRNKIERITRNNKKSDEANTHFNFFRYKGQYGVYDIALYTNKF